MHAVEIIIKKRDGGELSREEIRTFIEGFTRGEIPDYQAAAWAMAVMLRGMTARETLELTLALAESGEQLDLRGVVPLAVDKHSTGGVGDKTTLVVEPLVAALGLAVGKMSGRGLGYSGGTLDKMESIPGYRVALTTEEFLRQLRRVGQVLSGQSVDLAPADGKLYALRDVTGTVPSIPLIASSVMCKKLAGGTQVIVLDVKCGVGAFMPTVEEAGRLARLMVRIGSQAGRTMAALISDMNQPLGNAVGNALEVAEAIETLSGGGPGDFREHCLHVAAHLVLQAGRAGSLRQAKSEAERALEGGAALAKFRALVEAQGGDVRCVDEPERLPGAKVVRDVPSPGSGWVKWVDAREVGETVISLGGGRAKKGDSIDHSVGIIVHKKVGDRVAKGERLFTVHAATPEGAERAEARVLAAHRISRSSVEALPLFYRTIRG